MSGHELAAVITRIYSHPRIVLMSGYVGAADTAGARGGMLLRMLPKPFHAAELLSAVAEAFAEDRSGENQ